MKYNREYVGHKAPEEREAFRTRAHLGHELCRALEDLGTVIQNTL